jgi:autotransporter-associated beta strand protein
VVNASVNSTLGTTLDLNGVSIGSGESLTLASGSLAGDSRTTLRTVGTTTNTWAGSVLLTGSKTVQFNVTTGGQLEISGPITHSAFTGPVTLRGGGTGTLSGGVSLGSSTVVSVNEATSVWNITTSGNTWGNTNVFRGTLVLGANDALPTTTSLNLGGTDGSGTLKLNGRSQTVAGLTTNVTTTTNKIVNGSATAGALTVNSSTANAFAGILGGDGTDENLFSLTKSGSSTLTLSGTNTYSGDTTVSEGSLTLNNPNANNESSTVNIAASGATLALNFDETGGPVTDTVDKLFIGGVQQNLGVYKAADNVTDSGTPIAQITGPGTLAVTAGPGGLSPYDDWADDFPGFTPTTPSLDFDNDGIDNLLEFVLGGNPTLSEPGIAPAVNASGSDLVVTFKRSDASELQPVTVKVQVSDDLSTWNPANDITIGAVGVPIPIPPTNATYTVAENAAAADTIVVTIPKAAAARKFARVEANN